MQPAVPPFKVSLYVDAKTGACDLQDEIYFNCHNCSQTGYRPFELNKTSGFQLTIRHTNSDYSEYTMLLIQYLCMTVVMYDSI